MTKTELKDFPEKDSPMRRFMTCHAPIILTLAVACSCSLNAEEKTTDNNGVQQVTEVELSPADNTQFTVGSVAPPLNVSDWITNGNGKFSPVTQFEPGKVYVVEFWATWCGVCIASMPHVSELQQKYGDDVHIISVSDEPRAKVDRFLDRPSRRDPNYTYREVASSYSLATDPDGSTHAAYMDAAKLDGLPYAFIVGKDGRIDWIGHPMAMDEPLDQVVHDRWNRQEFRTEYLAIQNIEAKLLDVNKALDEEKIDVAVGILDKLVAESPKSMGMRLSQMKLMIHLQTDENAALKLAKSLTDSTEDPEALSAIGWMVYQVAVDARRLGKPLLEQGVASTQKAIEHAEGWKKADAYDTLAHLQQFQGDLDGAIQSTSKAIELAPEESTFQKYLDSLNRRKDSLRKSDASTKQKTPTSAPTTPKTNTKGVN